MTKEVQYSCFFKKIKTLSLIYKKQEIKKSFRYMKIFNSVSKSTNCKDLDYTANHVHFLCLLTQSIQSV